MLKKKAIIISILSALVTGVVCSMIVYTLTLQSLQMENSDFYGTYQFDMRDLDNIKYLAVIPPLKGDTKKGQFQWYNVDKKMLAQGTCKIDKRGFITFYVDEKIIATMFVGDGKYFFVDDTLETQEITRISKEPMVSIPLDY